MIDFRELVKAGVHFGHQTSRWMPKMEPYIWGVKNKVHLIDVSKTAHQLERAAQFLKSVAAEGKQVLWVGTKKSARDIVQAVATKIDMPYVNHRWIGGTLSNFDQVKKSRTRLLHFEDVLEKSEKYPHYTKKELNEITKSVERLKAVVGGVRKLTWPVGAVVLVDVNKEQSALREAVSVGVPVVALVDTNADPSLVDYVIPANDDAPKSIKVLLEYLGGAVEQGKQAAKKAQTEAKEVKASAKSQPAKKATADLEVEVSLEDDIDDIDDIEHDQVVAKVPKKKAAAIESEDEKDAAQEDIKKKSNTATRKKATASTKQKA